MKEVIKSSKRFFALILLATVFGFTQNALSQVTIGSAQIPDTNALLDLTQGATTTKGLLLPRVNLVSERSPLPMTAHTAGMTVYNLAASTDTVPSSYRVSPGFYYNTGSRWERIRTATERNWFYMPSIVLDVSTAGPHTVNLHNKYANIFQNRAVRSPNSPDAPKTILGKGEVYYYVTGYDASVFQKVTLTDDGKLIYEVNVNNVSDTTYMNIIFVER